MIGAATTGATSAGARRKLFPQGRNLLPLAWAGALLLLLAGCGEEEAGAELGARPTPGKAAPSLEVRTGPDADAEAAQLTEMVAGSPAVIYFDSPTSPIAHRCRAAFGEAAKTGTGVTFVAVVLAEEEWPAPLPEGARVFYCDRTEADDAYGTSALPLIVAVDGEGVVRHVGGFMNAEELVALARGLPSPAPASVTKTDAP